MSDAKLLVEEWVEQLDEVRAYPTSPDVEPDMAPRNELQKWFGVHPQHRIDQAREASGKAARWQPELFGDDRWAEAKSGLAGKEDMINDAKTYLRMGGDSRKLADRLVQHGVLPYSASDNTHHLKSVYMGQDEKLVGVYHRAVHNAYGYEAPYSKSHERALVPLEGQSHDPVYVANGTGLADGAGDVHDWGKKPGRYPAFNMENGKYPGDYVPKNFSPLYGDWHGNDK